MNVGALKFANNNGTNKKQKHPTIVAASISMKIEKKSNAKGENCRKKLKNMKKYLGLS